MPQCKRSDCREPALPTGKRYCKAHRAEYDRKRAEALVRQAALPECREPRCTNKVPRSSTEHGVHICHDCEDARLRREAEYTKQRQFEDATTVEALKEWMRKYML